MLTFWQYYIIWTSEKVNHNLTDWNIVTEHFNIKYFSPRSIKCPHSTFTSKWTRKSLKFKIYIMSFLTAYVFKMFGWKLFLTAIEFYLKYGYVQKYKYIVIYLTKNEYILSQDTNVLWFTWPKWIYTISRYKCIVIYVAKNEYILLYSSKKKMWSII